MLGLLAAVAFAAALPCGLDADALAQHVPDGWKLTAVGEGASIALTLTDPKGVVQATRRLAPQPDDCPALARTIAVLVGSWLANPFAAPAPVVAERPKRARPTPVAAAPAPEPRPEPEPEPVAAEPPPALPAPSIAFPVRPVPPPPSEIALAVLVAAGASAGIDDSATASGNLTLDWSLTRRWGLAFDAGAQTDRAQATSNAAILAQLHWAGVAGRAVLNPEGTHRLALSAGLQLVHLHLAGRNGTNAQGAADNFLPALTAHLESRHAIAPSFFVLARASVVARARLEAARLDDVTLVVPPWGFALQVGLGWNFF